MSTGQTLADPLISIIPVDYQVRTYYAVGVLMKILKYMTLVTIPISAAEGWEYYRFWLLVDLLYCIMPLALRIPLYSMQMSMKWTILYFVSFWVSDVSVVLQSSYSQPSVARLPGPFMMVALLNPFAASFKTYIGHEYNSGTISLVDTARLNPSLSSFCLKPEDNSIFIPVALQYPDLSGLKFSFAPLQRDHFDTRHLDHTILSARQLQEIKKRHTNQTSSSRYSSDDIVFLEVSRPGILRLERVVYFPNLDARVTNPLEVAVSPCPQAKFAVQTPPSGDLRCQGCEPSSSPLAVDVFGVPPLSLTWFRIFNGNRTPSVEENLLPNAPNKQYNSGGTRHSQHRLEDARQARSMRITLPLSCMDVGDHIYVLDVITDSFGNEINLHDELVSTDQITTAESIYPLTVLQRPVASFENCSKSNTHYVQQGTKGSLTLVTNSTDLHDYNNIEVLLKYRPTALVHGGPLLADIYLWEKTFFGPGGESRIQIPAVSPGEYTLANIKDKYCLGQLPEEPLCPVADLPLPSVSVNSWTELTECYGAKGANVALSFNGTAPFTLYYTLLRKGSPPKAEFMGFDGHHTRLDIQPSQGGDYVYSFDRLSDAHYQNISLEVPTIVQTVQDPASAVFVSGRFDKDFNRRVMNTCDDTVEVTVELSGIAPWALGIKTTGPSDPKFRTMRNIQQRRYSFDIEVPFGMREREGAFDVSIVTIEDFRECKVDITTPGLLVNVRENKPTVRFEGERIIEGIESEVVDLPIRLTGSPPWTVGYRRDESREEILTLNTTSSQDQIPATVPGLYRITTVESRDCPGSVLPGVSSFQVNAIPKPSVGLTYPKGVFYQSSNGSHILRHSCKEALDYVLLDLKGHPPFHFSLQITERPSESPEVSYRPTFYSPDDQYQLQLQTSNVGHVLYELIQIDDSAYQSTNRTPIPLTQRERTTFQQQIHALPSAHFRSQGILEQYLHGKFMSLDWDGSVSFSGTPPFQVQLSIQHLESGQLDLLSVNVPTSTWRINIPDYTFHTLGRHVVEIVSVSDASGCPHQPSLAGPRSLTVDVNPSPLIAPRDPYFCVGDVAHFDLQGSPPWKIDYRLNGRQYTKEISSSPFSLPLERPGHLSITSVTHREIRRPVVLNESFHVFARPSAVVSYPNRVQHDIPIGEHVYVEFTFLGVPPFTFTYQRVNSGNEYDYDKTNSPQERHTVFDVEANHHTLDASYEGAWEVIEIADKYCRRP